MTTVSGILRFIGAALNAMFFAALELIVIITTRNDRLFHALARAWAHSTLWMCGTRVVVKGLDNVPFNRSYVYVSNHASMFDIPIILASIPDQIRIMYKKELHWIPVFGWGLKFGSYIAIDRGHGSEAKRNLEKAAGTIASGASVLLYAEGTRTLDGRLQPFKRGAFHLAVRSGVPVVPLTINGTFHILRKRSFVVRPGQAELILERPIDVHEGGKDEEHRLMGEVRSAIEKHYVDQ